MPLTRKRATIWTSSDGAEFQSFKEAADHEHMLTIRKVIAGLLDEHASYGEIDVMTAVDTIIANWPALDKLFRKSRTAYKKEARPASVEVEPLA